MSENVPAPLSRRPKRIAYTRVLLREEGGWLLRVANPVSADVVHFAIGLRDEALLPALRRLGIGYAALAAYFAHRNNGSNVLGRCKTFGERFIVVRTRFTPTSPVEIGTLAHEIQHAVCRILDRHLVTHAFDNEEEVRCCLLNFYLDQVLCTLKPVLLTYENPRLSFDDTFYLDYHFDNKTARQPAPETPCP